MMTPAKAIIASAFAVFLFLLLVILVARTVTPKTAGLAITAMSSFSALSTAFGFQILSLRREVRRTTGLDEDRRVLLKRRLDRSIKTLFARWSLSFGCGLIGAALGLVVRELPATKDAWQTIAVGFTLCGGSVLFLFLMILEYRSLFRFASELEEHAEDVQRKREWAERMKKIANE